MSASHTILLNLHSLEKPKGMMQLGTLGAASAFLRSKFSVRLGNLGSKVVLCALVIVLQTSVSRSGIYFNSVL